MGCCGDDDEQPKDLTDGKVLEDRDCTDWLVIIVWMLFMGGWITVLVFALVNGNPRRIILPDNNRGDLCGVDGLDALPNSFTPFPNRFTFSVCVAQCPSILDYVCNNDVDSANSSRRNDFFNTNQAEFVESQALALRCELPGESCTAQELSQVEKFLGLLVRFRESKCFVTIYASTALLNRCLPNSLLVQNGTLLEQFNFTVNLITSFISAYEFTNFFTTGYDEVIQSWRVIAVSTAAAIVLSILWVMLMRCLLAPLVYLSLLLLFATFILFGVGAYFYGEQLNSMIIPGDQGTRDQVRVLRAAAFISWILGGIYLVVVLVLIARIRIAIALLKEASRCFQNNFLSILLEPFLLVFLVAVSIYFLVSVAYVQSIVVPVNASFTQSLQQVVGGNILNATFYNTSIVAQESELINISSFEQNTVVTGLQAYNFFMYLWTANACVIYGFFVYSMICTTWYFSATGAEIELHDRGEGGRPKSAPFGTVCRSMCLGLTKHLGTVLFGSLLIALIQFIRALVLYFQHKFLDSWKESATAKCILYCINCCLACIERCITVITKSAITVCCVRNTNFCRSALYSLTLLINNVLRVGTLTTISTITIFFLKLFITGCTAAVGYGLLLVPQLTEGRSVPSKLFPIIAIIFIAYLVSAVFLVLFEGFVDAIMICFFIDEKEYNGKYMDPELAELVGKFSDIEKSRKEYEDKLRGVKGEPASK